MEVWSPLLVEQKAHWAHSVCSAFSTLAFPLSDDSLGMEAGCGRSTLIATQGEEK